MKPTPRAVTITGIIAYVILSLFVVSQTVAPMNTFVYELVQPLSGRVFAYLTELGSAQVVVVLTLIAMLYWFWRGEKVEAWRLALVGATTLILTQALKILYGIDRPLIDASLDATTYSFPSGHASGSLAFYGLLAYVFYRRNSSPLLVGALVLFVLVISMSRVILNVHYFSDVLGGWLVGLTVIAASEWFLRRKSA